MKNSIMITAILIIVVGAIAFFAGMKYQQSQVRNFPRGSVQRNNQTGRGVVVGQIISQDDKSMTVKLQDGSSKIVLLSNSTTVSKTDSGSKSDLEVGINVAVSGITNSDGSVTAQNVQLNPRFGERQNSPSADPR